MRTLYFDYNATTPLDPSVQDAMFPSGVLGNPSSVHHAGRKARALLDDARDRMAHLWRCRPSEILFTGGGTESNNHALLGTARSLRQKGRHIVCSAIEHHAVLQPLRYLAKQEGFELSLVKPDASGRIHPESVRELLKADTILVSVMAANNEVGTIQPIGELGALCRERGVVFHTDAAQWFGKEPVPSIDCFQADLVTVCAHKLHGPIGAGALYIRSPLQPSSLLLGGSQENDRRGGTENLPAILGMALALELFVQPPVFSRPALAPLMHRISNLLSRIPGCLPLGDPSHRLGNTLSAVFEGCDTLSLLANLDLAGVCASGGSACSSGALEPSHVVQAMGFSPSQAAGLVRFSLGRESTLEEVEVLEGVLPEIVERIRGESAQKSL